MHQVGDQTKFIRLVHFFSWNRVMELYWKRLLTFEDTFYVGKDVIPYCVYVGKDVIPYCVYVGKDVIPYCVYVGKDVITYCVYVGKDVIPYCVYVGKDVIPYCVYVGKGVIPHCVYVGKDVIPCCVYESIQQEATLQVNLLFLVDHTCFGRCFRPSSGALDCIYSFW